MDRPDGAREAQGSWLTNKPGFGFAAQEVLELDPGQDLPAVFPLQAAFPKSPFPSFPALARILHYRGATLSRSFPWSPSRSSSF